MIFEYVMMRLAVGAKFFAVALIRILFAIMPAYAGMVTGDMTFQKKIIVINLFWSPVFALPWYLLGFFIDYRRALIVFLGFFVFPILICIFLGVMCAKLNRIKNHTIKIALWLLYVATFWATAPYEILQYLSEHDYPNFTLMIIGIY